MKTYKEVIIMEERLEFAIQYLMDLHAMGYEFTAREKAKFIMTVLEEES